MARSKTTTHHPEIRHSRRGAASASAVAVPPASTPPPTPVVSPPLSATLALLHSLALSSLAPQPTAATSKVPSTAAIPTQVTSQGELDEGTGSDNGTGLSRAQKGKQKIDECSNISDIPTEHQNVGHPSSDVPTSATHPQLFEQSLLRKGTHVFTPLNYKFGTHDAHAQFHKFISNRDFVMEFNVKEDVLRERVKRLIHVGA
ncbi:hypothetical protein Fot_28969 [Forsythia ovata]|uniref:Uncharacterized protein n=1 Tax=Forsythia ovata TaxID=205694 RepID=A0ABD1TQZ3_9LAMI